VEQLAEQNKQSATSPVPTSDGAVSGEKGGMAGMDEVVNERLAEAAGVPPRDPYIDTESKGDLWNMLLLLVGAICGFILGRWWHLLWGSRKRAQNNIGNSRLPTGKRRKE